MTQRDAAGPTAMSDVVVVGGGIGGLAAALALRSCDLAVTLLEQAPEFGEVGAGLQLGPNATRLLRSWGLLDQVVAAGVQPQHLVFRDAVSGEELARQELTGPFLERYGAPYVVVHRSDLHAIICEAVAGSGVELHTDTRVLDVERTATGATVLTDDGRRFGGAVVIAADGLGSRLRRLVSDDSPVASGYVAFRGTIPMSDASMSEVRLESDLYDVVAWLGPQCHFVQYPLRGGELLNQVAVFRSPALARGEAAHAGELEQAFAACHPQLRAGLRHLWQDRCWPMADRGPITSWAADRFVLTGDAAHPMLQYLAQGACQALEDADALERGARRHLSPGSPATAWDDVLADFVAERAPRTAQVQQRARLWGETWHVSGVPRLLRNELFRRHGEPWSYLDWLYGPPA